MERKKTQLFRSREQKYCILFDFLHWTFVGVNFPMSHYHSYSLISSDMGICMPVHLNPNLDIHMLISFQVISFSFLLYCRTHTHYTSLFIKWIFFFVLMVIRLNYYFVIRPSCKIECILCKFKQNWSFYRTFSDFCEDRYQISS